MGNSFEEIMNKKKKCQILTKHGVENWVAMATSYTLDKKNLRNLVLQ